MPIQRLLLLLLLLSISAAVWSRNDHLGSEADKLVPHAKGGKAARLKQADAQKTDVQREVAAALNAAKADAESPVENQPPARPSWFWISVVTLGLVILSCYIGKKRVAMLCVPVVASVAFLAYREPDQYWWIMTLAQGAVGFVRVTIEQMKARMAAKADKLVHCKHLVDSLVQDPHETFKVHMLPYGQLVTVGVMIVAQGLVAVGTLALVVIGFGSRSIQTYSAIGYTGFLMALLYLNHFSSLALKGPREDSVYQLQTYEFVMGSMLKIEWIVFVILPVVWLICSNGKGAAYKKSMGRDHQATFSLKNVSGAICTTMLPTAVFLFLLPDTFLDRDGYTV